MAKRGRPSKKELEAMERKIKWSLDPETWRSVVGVILLILGFILLLSIFGGAGALGSFLIKIIRVIIGYLVLFIPLVFIFFGIAIFLPQKIALRAPTIFGTMLLMKKLLLK